MPVRLANSLKALAAALVIAPVAAAAQVKVEPAEAPGGADVEIVAAVAGSACGGAGLSALLLDVPEGLLRVRPRSADGWRLTVQEGALAYIYHFRDALISSGVKTVEWRAERPATGDFLFEAAASLAPLPAGERLAFDATLICGDGVKVRASGDGLALTVTPPRSGRH